MGVYIFFFFFFKVEELWIELPWTENLVKTYAQHTETLDGFFNLEVPVV